MAKQVRKKGWLPLLKSFLPKGLLGRALLILVMPMLIVQIVSAFVFFNTHWDLITRRLTQALAGDIAAVIEMMRVFPGDDSFDAISRVASERMEFDVEFEKDAILERSGLLKRPSDFGVRISGAGMEKTLIESLNERIKRPLSIDAGSSDTEISIRIQLTEGVLDILVPRKRLYNSTSVVFILWSVGSALLMMGVAMLFLRNQVRSVKRFADAAEKFGKGYEVQEFKAEGAAEVRQAAAAFRLMQERIRRQVLQRTEMLAGVSHDLRTPLTRMKLQLAMMDGEGTEELSEDVSDMERMIEGYLAFARGDGEEKIAPADLSALIEDVAAKARRSGAKIDYHSEGSLILPLRPHAIERAIANLVSNAARYSSHISVRVRALSRAAEIIIDDDGPGIPPDKREDVFQAFFRLEQSRNQDTGGVGLGLSIARDAVRSHGGEIFLEDSPLGGLRVRVRLPQ